MNRRTHDVIAALALACLIGTQSPQITLAESVDYKLTVRNDWSQDHHKPGAPAFSSVVQPHFSHLGGGTHNSDLVVWELGQLSSSGMIKMQETGWIDEPSNRTDLKNEFDAHMSAGTAGSFLNYPIPNPWFPAGTETELNFSIEDTHPLVTLVSMLGPSPDWFIGVSGLSLRENGQWKQLVEVDLYPYDGGSRSRDNQFSLFGPLESPQQPIRLITDDDDTLLLGSLPIGKFTFELLTPQTLSGDFNDDGVVDSADYTLWRDNRGQAVILPGDDTPGTVDQSDYASWRDNYGASSGSASSGGLAIPEPSTLVLLLVLIPIGIARMPV